MIVCIALGLVTTEGRRARIAVAVALAVCYAYAFASPQRGGLLVLHVVIALFALRWILTMPLARRRRRLQVSAVAPVVEPRGFYGVEPGGPQGAPLRWSSKVGLLCLEPRSSQVRIRFAQVDPRIESTPRTVTLRIGDQIVDRFEVLNRDIITRFVTVPYAGQSGAEPPFGACRAQSVRLSIENSRTWSPVDVGYGADQRHLGIAVFAPVSVEPARSPVSAP